ncbi:MAG: hypothetical protein KAK00_04205 [Nanoarchaeota archaeon]|nr:hypothetical protein [Nanoarchaeota archaeon]
MKFRKTIKKIVALGMGITMLGAAVSAADLNDYPAPFVSNGKFTGTLVVGDNAAAEDVVGVSDIAMSLQYAASVKTGTGTSATTIIEGDAYKFEKSANKLNLYQNISDIRTTLTDADLNALADGTFKGKTAESYTQTLKAPNGTTQVVWDEYTDINEEPALYLKFTATQAIMNYKLNFGTSVSSDLASGRHEDFEDNKVTILGKEYTVTKSENLTSNNIRWTLMSGSVQDTLEVGQTKTYTINGVDYEVTVMVVSGDTAATALAKLIVNDEVTKSLSKDQTYTLKDGIDLGIKEVLPTKSGDAVQNLVEFYLGAQKLVLDGNDNSMDIGDNSNIEDVSVIMGQSVSGTEAKLSNINIVWAPASNLYVPVGGTLKESAEIDEATDYVQFLDKLGLDYTFSGLTAGNTETVKLKRYNDDAIQIEFTNKNGVEYKVPIITVPSNGTVYLGKSQTDSLRVHETGAINASTTVCDEDTFIIESDEISRVLQLKSIKNGTDSKYVKIKDLGTGDSTNYDFTVSNGVADLNIDGYTYQVTVVGGSSPTCITLTETTDDADHIAGLWTKYGTLINLTDSLPEYGAGARYYPIVFKEDKDKQEDDDSRDEFAFNFSYESAKTNADFAGDVIEPTAFELVMRALDSDSKKSQGYTKWGTFLERDTNGDQDEWTITIPEEEAKAEVYITAGVTSISTGDAVSGDAVIINKIDVGATKLASEIAGLETSQNLIIVGGPCANAAVEAASADFPTCSGWSLEPGEALIQVVEQEDGSVALLVAGTTASDTRTATGVLAEATKLQELADDVTKQLVTVVSGQEVLTDVPEVVEDVADADAVDADADAADADADADAADADADI